MHVHRGSANITEWARFQPVIPFLFSFSRSVRVSAFFKPSLLFYPCVQSPTVKGHPYLCLLVSGLPSSLISFRTLSFVSQSLVQGSNIS